MSSDLQEEVSRYNRERVLISPDNGTLSAQYSQIPPRALNGGLYTGEVFMKGAPWANRPVRPETVNYIYHNLRSMHIPPEEAIYMFPGEAFAPATTRPSCHSNTSTRSKTPKRTPCASRPCPASTYPRASRNSADTLTSSIRHTHKNACVHCCMPERS